MVFDHDYEKYPELTNKQLQQFQFSSPHKQITEDFDATVVKVHDGDTVTLTTDFRNFKFPLRILDIDSPEMNDGGEIARDWLKSRILNQQVRILIDKLQRVGKYGRLLGKIFYKGMNIGMEEIHLGLAVPFGRRKEGEIETTEKMFRLRQWL